MEKIKFTDWKKLDLRVGQIKEVKKVPNKDRLYKMKVDIGHEIQMISSLVPYYTEEELQDKKIIVFANLEPAKFAGLTSEGMLLAAGSDETKTCVLLTIDKDIPNGTAIT